jgi:hypothetical protein
MACQPHRLNSRGYSGEQKHDVRSDSTTFLLQHNAAQSAGNLWRVSVALIANKADPA